MLLCHMQLCPITIPLLLILSPTSTSIHFGGHVPLVTLEIWYVDNNQWLLCLWLVRRFVLSKCNWFSCTELMIKHFSLVMQVGDLVSNEMFPWLVMYSCLQLVWQISCHCFLIIQSVLLASVSHCRSHTRLSFPASVLYSSFPTIISAAGHSFVITCSGQVSKILWWMTAES